MSDHKAILVALAKNRRTAHSVLFKHRHPLNTPDFHGEMIDDFHGDQEHVVLEAFRGGAKSTIGEEATCISALFVNFANCVIVSSTERRAAERLEAIKHELDNNENLISLFGEQRGEVWQAHKAVLYNGVCLQALGVGQAVRGIKHHEFRPDFLWIDDIEDDESVRTPEASHDRLKWLFGTLLPVCAKHARVRVTGNRLSPDAVMTKLANLWPSRRYPICYQSLTTGEEIATWPELYDMTWVNQKRNEYHELGLDQIWASEYMCEAISESVKPFKPEDYRIVPRVRTYEPVQAMWDPAKTTKGLRHQAYYGKAVWSWIGNKLVVWQGGARPMMPSELINDVFATEKEFSCVTLGIEADGLEDWLTEPMNLEQIKRRVFLPQLQAVRAPKDKDNFIRALQPHFMSGQIEFAQDCPEIRTQMINFPSGRKDALNALAYALKLRPGQPVYDGFTAENVVEGLEPHLRTKCYLCLNADGANVTGVLVQFDGALCVLADWIEQGDPGQCVETICKQASLASGMEFTCVVPPKELQPFDNKGTAAAIRRLPRAVSKGHLPEKGRAEIRDLIGRRSKGTPLLQVSTEATWTLRAFSGGYHKVFNRQGQVEGEPEPGGYKTLMEALESFAGIMHHDDDNEPTGNTRVGRGGRMYESIMVSR